MNTKAPIEPKFEFLDHSADKWVHAWGPTLESTFEQCVYALMLTMTDPSKITPDLSHEFNFEDEDKGALLVNFLSEFLFLFDARGYLFGQIQIDPIRKQADGKYHLHAVGKCEQFKLEKHFQDTEVKAITYSYLDIHETPDRVDIKIVYDI